MNFISRNGISMSIDSKCSIEISAYSKDILTIELRTKNPYTYSNISVINTGKFKVNEYHIFPAE